MRLSYLRHRLPQLTERELADLPADFARYQRELNRALHEMSKADIRAMRELDTAPSLLVTLQATAQTLTVDAELAVAFDTVVVDTMGWWKGASYIPKEPGFYLCSWAVDVRDTSAFAATAYAYTKCANAEVIAYGNGTAPEIHVHGSAPIECDGTTGINVSVLVHQATAPTVGAFTPYRTFLAINYIGKRPFNG